MSGSSLPPPAPLVRAVGIDPGATTGLVCVELTPDLTGALVVGPATARWVGAQVVRASASTKMTDAEQDATLYRRILAQLDVWHPTMIVLEEPLDAMASWSRRNGRGIGAGRGLQRTGTAFALGRAYGLALAAAATCRSPATRALSITSYPVTTSRKLARLGWMQGTAPLPTKRADTLQRMRALAMPVAGRAVALALTEDQLMALGVLAFHLEQLRAAPLAVLPVTA